jgi:hypothetical protein
MHSVRIDGRRRRSGRLLHIGARALVTAVSLLAASAASAACNPETCEAAFDCGFRACDGVACATFFEDAGTPCRPTAGECDVEETCNGHALACPADDKRTSECRAASDPCDGAERCDGSSNDCPPDAPLAPQIARIRILDRVFVSGDGTPGDARELAFQMDGADLCRTEIGIFGVGTLAMGDDQSPASRIAASLFYNNASPRFTEETFSFDVNRGAIQGTLDFAGGAQTGYVAVDSPAESSIVGSEPSITIANACLSCDFVRLQIAGLQPSDVFLETGPDFAGPPLDGSVTIGLDSFAGDALPGGLPEGAYALGAEGVDGAVLLDTTFDQDPSGAHFTYVYGSSVFNEVDFEVSEPDRESSLVAALAPLAACTAARGARRRRR